MFGLGDQGEPSSNKKTDVNANKTSNTFFPSIKAVYDWATGLFVKGAASSTANAIARFDGTTGKVVKNSGCYIDDLGRVGIGTVPQWGFHLLASGNSVALFEGTAAAYHILKANLGAENSKAGAFVYGSAGSMQYRVLNDNLTDKLTAFTVTNAGNFGIGTATPTTKLDVDGTSRFRNSAAFNGQIIDNVGSSGVDGQVLKKVDSQVLWSNP